jgi:hypothetical protein
MILELSSFLYLGKLIKYLIYNKKYNIKIYFLYIKIKIFIT